MWVRLPLLAPNSIRKSKSIMVLARVANPLCVKSTAGSIPVSSATNLKGGCMFTFIGNCINQTVIVMIGSVFITLIIVLCGLVFTVLSYLFNKIEEWFDERNRDEG